MRAAKSPGSRIIPFGFEWCVNPAAVDVNGVVYANSEDGNMFAINQGGTLKQKIFQQLALGAAFTPASLGSDGKIYSQNAGHMFVIGSSYLRSPPAYLRCLPRANSREFSVQLLLALV
jgi:outer membrane protein assembly factor BamB